MQGEWMLRGRCLGNLSWEVDLREWQLPSLIFTLCLHVFSGWLRLTQLLYPHAQLLLQALLDLLT